jgi:hypothetical protein
MILQIYNSSLKKCLKTYKNLLYLTKLNREYISVHKYEKTLHLQFLNASY